MTNRKRRNTTKQMEEKELNSFLMSEYTNISQAHYKALETVSSFFRYYIIIMSIPVSVAILFHTKVSFVFNSDVVIGWLFFALVIIGLGMLGHIINLRADAVLYARSVNGIRKYFFDRSKIPVNYKNRLKILPQSVHVPRYFEKTYFLPIVIVFAVFNTVYGYFASDIIFKKAYVPYTEYWLLISCILIFILNFILYFLIAQYRENQYMRSNIIGVDIDGVLNNQCEQFCNMINKKHRKKIKPQNIEVIPVHNCSSLNISRDMERDIFNDPLYWEGMKVNKNAANTIKKLRNVFNLKIDLITFRSWPDHENFLEFKKIFDLFMSKMPFGFKKTVLIIFKHTLLTFRFTMCWKIRKWPITEITRKWLRNNDIQYNNLYIEKMNDHTFDSRGLFDNRFRLASTKRYRYFIEDDLEKAIKLSYMCDVVFLISHPYNKKNKKMPNFLKELFDNLPANIIRLKNWDEIYRYIQMIS